MRKRAATFATVVLLALTIGAGYSGDATPPDTGQHSMNSERSHENGPFWQTYDPVGMNRIVRFPELFEIRLSAFAPESKSYTSKFYFIEYPAEAGNALRAGAHTADCRYASAEFSFAGFDFRVEYANLAKGELACRVAPIAVSDPGTLVLVEVIRAWDLEGEVRLEGNNAISFPSSGGEDIWVAAGQDFQSSYHPGTPMTFGVHSSEDEMVEHLKSRGKLNELEGKARIAATAFNARLPLKIRVGEKLEDVSGVDGIIDRARSDYEAKCMRISGGPFERCARDAVSATNWCTLWDQLEGRPYTTVTRAWIDRYHTFITQAGPAAYESLGVDGTYRGRLIGLWDSLFSAILHSIESLELSEADIIAALDDSSLVRGEYPANFLGFGVKSEDRSQPPIGSLAVWKVYRKFGNRNFLEWAYPRLKKWHEWWKKDRDGNNDGLLEWGSDASGQTPTLAAQPGTLDAASAESGMDNSPLYDDAEYYSETGTMNLSDIGLNSLFAADALYLSRIAEEIGLKSDSETFSNEHALLARKIGDELWNGKREAYLDKYWNGEFSSRIAPTTFYPLLARIASAAKAERITKTHLYNEEEFWGEFVLPSISRNDPAFNEQLYWRGRIWPSMNYLVYLGLREYDELDEAAHELARKSVALFKKEWNEHGHCHENYSAITGTGDDVPTPSSLSSLGSDRFYAWGALLALMGIEEIMDVEMDEGIRFGCRFLEAESTISNIALTGSSYTIQTSQARTVALRDGKEFFSSRPGTNVRNYAVTEDRVTFRTSGNGQTEVTVCEFAPGAEVLLRVDDDRKEAIRAGDRGEVTFRVDLTSRYTSFVLETGSRSP